MELYRACAPRWWQCKLLGYKGPMASNDNSYD
jgi:hypothetical protein